ncbi:MAG: zf-HC2 domain-containing protein [Oscillibacter sp.]|nr:zf-HC2 domain-containing protein [Oscillibacter sp.]
MRECEYVKLLDEYLDGELDDEVTAQVQTHLASCPECRAYVREWREIREAFPREEEAPEGFAAAVTEAAAKAPQSRPKKYPWRSLALAAACLALVALIQRTPLLQGMGAAQKAAPSAPAETVAETVTESTAVADAEEEPQAAEYSLSAGATASEKAASDEAAPEAVRNDAAVLRDAGASYRVAYVGWSEEGFTRAMQAGALNGEKMTISSVRHLPVFRFDTAEDLADFAQSVDGAFALEQSYAEVPSFRETTAGYDDAFFAENALLGVYVEAGSGSYRYGVRDVAIADGAACVEVEQTNSPEFGTADMAGWLLFAEVSEEALAGCEVFDAFMVN